MARTINVYLCGLPGSGNHLCMGIVQRCAKVTGVSQLAQKLWHGNILPTMPEITKASHIENYIIIPVRSEVWRQRSCVRRKIMDQYPPRICALNVAKFVAKYEIPPYYVSYEALTQDDPEANGRHLAYRLCLDWAPFPKHTSQHLKRRHHGAVYNGNTPPEER